MESLKLLPTLDKISLAKQHNRYTLNDIGLKMSEIKRDSFLIETAVGLDIAFNTIFDERNIPDDVHEAYNMAFSNVSQDFSLYDRYSEMLDKGPESVSGFVSSMKGKIFELRLPELLENEFPGFNVDVSQNPIQEIFDITLTPTDGETILLQAKMGSSSYASDVLERMQDNPDVLFATSNEIRDTILSSHPELADQFVDMDLANYDFTENVKGDLSLLAGNLGIDVPDDIGEIVPYVGEIILGILLIMDLIKVQKDFKSCSATDKAKLSAVKSIVLLSRFGVSTVCTTVGAAGGAAGGSAIAPGPGSAVGGGIGAIGGAVVSAKLNKHLKPYYMDFALGITGLSEDDIFYFRNKAVIDDIGASLSQTKDYVYNNFALKA